MAEQPHPFGHRFVIGLQPAPGLTDHDRRLLQALRPAGVVLFRDNFVHGAPYDEWLASLRALLDEVRACSGRERLLVGIDHEGGRVQRPPPPLTHFAYAREWAPFAADVGRAMGVELRSIGVNVTFAPVVDVHSNPENPVIGPRALGPDPEQVARTGLEFIAAVEAEGVAACPKHFPGHGDTAVDSHYGLPVVEHDLETLRRRELVPFRAAIGAGVRLVMTSHILFPRVDPDTPATMSKRIVGELLRDELGFDGVVVTDDIGMRAVSDAFDRPEAAERIMNAGTDLIAICAYGTDTARALRIADHIAAGHRSGRIGSRALDAAAERIERLLGELPRHPVAALGAEVFARHAGLAPLHDAQRRGGGTWERTR